AFLNSSNAVHEYLLRKIAPDETPNALAWGAGLVFSGVAVGLSIWLWDYQGPFSPWLLMALALTLLIAQWRSVPQPTSLLRLAGVALALSVLYGGLKTATGWLLSGHVAEHTNQAFSLADIWACALFIILFVLAVGLRYYAHLGWTRRFSITLFAGLYLDEWFTKVTLKIWPVTLPAHSKAKHHGVALLFPNLSKGWKK
ncbi:MAG: hypothetical protein ACPHUL_06220, partial [Marinomonas gallaica]